MAYDYRMLRGKIREVFETQDAFSKAMGLSNTSISLKLNNRVEWTQQEINRASDILKIPEDKVYNFFFTEKV
jgi:hypothetical protein